MNNVTVTKLPKSKVELKIEVPAPEFTAFIGKALAEIVKDAEIPGFRKGMAPKEIVKSRVGQAKILDRAAALAIEATFPLAVSENKVEPLGYPEISITKIAEGNPLEYKAAVAVYPQVAPGDYKKIAAGFKMEEVKVTDDDIKRLKMEKERHAREHLRQDLLAELAAKATLEVPEILMEGETEKMMRQLKERASQATGMSFDEYAKKIGKTEAELRQAMAKDNEQKIKNYLILQEIAKLEKIEAGEAEIAEAMKKNEAGLEGESGAGDSEKEHHHNHLKDYYRETLRTEKTFEFLESLYKKA